MASRPTCLHPDSAADWRIHANPTSLCRAAQNKPTLLTFYGPQFGTLYPPKNWVRVTWGYDGQREHITEEIIWGQFWHRVEVTHCIAGKRRWRLVIQAGSFLRNANHSTPNHNNFPLSNNAVAVAFNYVIFEGESSSNSRIYKAINFSH